MAKYMKHPSQGLLLLSLFVLACSTIPVRISGRSIDAVRIATEETTTGGVTVDALYNGCYENRDSWHDQGANFCCIKDKNCWPSLQECMPNCPCKVPSNCSGKKSLLSDANMPSPVVQG